MPVLDRTVLYERYVKLGGRMVGFAGFEMPLQLLITRVDRIAPGGRQCSRERASDVRSAAR